MLIKLPGIVSGNRLSIIYKSAFVWISIPGSLVFTVLASHVQQHNEHIHHMKFIIHMHVKKNQPILVSLVGLSNLFFFTWNFVNRLKQTFLQTTLLLLADTEPIKIQRRLIDLSKTEKRVRSYPPAAHVLSSFLHMTGLFVRPKTQERGKECGSVFSRMWFCFQLEGRSVAWRH